MRTEISRREKLLLHVLKLFFEVPKIPRFWKFVSVGGGVMLVCTGIFYLLINVALIEKNLANFIVALIAIQLSFWLHTVFTWRDRSGSGLFRRFVEFHVSKAVTMLLNAGMFFLLATVLLLNYMIAYIVCLSIITLLNYVITNYIVFRGEKERK
jgi:putative flippase GtrA